MKLGTPVTEITSRRGERGAYGPLYEAIRKANGLYVPIACEDEKEKQRLHNALRQNGHFYVNVRGLTLFAKVKIVANGNGHAMGPATATAASEA